MTMENEEEKRAASSQMATDSLYQNISALEKICVYIHTYTHTYIQTKSSMTYAASSCLGGVRSLGKLH